MGFEIWDYTANSCKDDIEFVTEFPCFLGHPVDEPAVSHDEPGVLIGMFCLSNPVHFRI